ncbi:MAG: hypothetical protein GYA57_13210 [Myxococcales bacterium]|nr:hypothetical protein [Myxococcales bacterium]
MSRKALALWVLAVAGSGFGCGDDSTVTDTGEDDALVDADGEQPDEPSDDVRPREDAATPDDGVEPDDGDGLEPDDIVEPDDVVEPDEGGEPGDTADVPDVPPPECTGDGDCDDGIACTVDSCDPATSTCVFAPDDAACDDGDACNGVEVCAAGVGCESGVPVDCDDRVACTTDTCDPADGSCDHVADDSSCDDGIACTADTCDPAAGCVNAPVHAACDDGDACNGVEICVPGLGCDDGEPLDCDDGVDCTIDTCDPADGSCAHAPDDTVCPTSPFCSGTAYCDPVGGCLVTAPPSCNDGLDCTIDACDPATGACTHVANNAACSDGVFCNGDEVCDPTAGCVPGVRTCADSVACTVDTCDEDADACVWTPNDAACADADLCDGAEICNPVRGCVEGAPVDCDDGFACTTDACIPATGACSHVANDAACNDGQACNGVERCVVGSGCVPGTPVVCDDSVSCTTDTCENPAGTCQFVPSHALCPSGMVCVPSRGGCVPGTPCTTDAECVDGSFCNGVETCEATICAGGTPPNCDDTDACTIDGCSDTLGACTHTPQDRDFDTYGDAACGGADCNDLDPLIHPGVPDDDCDGVDDDCDGLTDGGLVPIGGTCTTSADCCTGSCIGGVCNSGYGLCESPGESCVSPAECCSGRCEVTASGTRECVGTGVCEAEGGACLFSADCCSAWCVAGACAVGSTCHLVSEPCANNYECCSGICDSRTHTCASVGGTCTPLYEVCTSDNGCCSGFCDGGRCGIGFFCRAPGELCNEGADCCNGICVGASPPLPGRCAFLGGCYTVGTPCTGNRNCCSKACVDPGTGVRVCTYLSGCRPMGEICTTDAECCGGLCRPDDRGLSMRCQNPPGCQPAGEMCFAGATNNCCGGSEYCRPTIAGVYRCWAPGWTDCLPEGDLCHFGDECCSGVCTLWPDGFYRCGATCVPNGGPCTSDFDCCEGVCRDGVCAPPDSSCLPLGEPCTLPEDCCSGFCVGGYCSIPGDT